MVLETEQNYMDGRKLSLTQNHYKMAAIHCNVIPIENMLRAQNSDLHQQTATEYRELSHELTHLQF